MMLLAIAALAMAMVQDVGMADSTYSAGILVTSKDVTTCPYRVIAPVSVGKRGDFSSTGFAAVYQKLREKAAKLGADAVILVTIGEKHVTAFSFGQRNAAGRAIQYVDKSCAPTH